MSDPAAVPRPTLRVPLVGLVAGTVCCVVLFALAKWVRVSEIDAGRYTKMSVSLLIFIAAGFAVGRAVRRSGHPQAFRVAAGGFGASLLGIAVGAVLWTFLENIVFKRLGDYPIYQEPTLFPLEIAILWMFGALPILGGIAAGLVLGGPAKRTTHN